LTSDHWRKVIFLHPDCHISPTLATRVPRHRCTIHPGGGPMAVPLTSLQAIAASFSAIRTGPELAQPGSPVVADVVGPTGALTATDLVSAPFSLTWISKDVRFNTATTEAAMTASPLVLGAIDALINGGMPAIVPVVGGVGGTQLLQGVPGELGQLAGGLPVPIEVPVQVDVTWTVRDVNGALVNPGPGTFNAPNGLAGHNAVFVFAPQTVELTSDVSPPVTQFFLRAAVTLTAGGTAHNFVLPDLPVLIPAVPIPSIVVFFLHTNFSAGAALVMVPASSPLRTLGQAQSALNTLDSIVSGLTSIAEFASFLLGIQQMTSALGAQPHVQFRAADSISNFNNITLDSGFWNDTEAEDELSSMIFIGPQGKTIECFKDRGHKGGKFHLTIGNKFHASIRSLHSNTPASGPDGNEINNVSGGPFGDELSSARFS
jgi:hypothetical protein